MKGTEISAPWSFHEGRRREWREDNKINQKQDGNRCFREERSK